MNKSLNRVDLEKISARGQAKGKQIELTDEICYSWGYTGKKKLVSSIGNQLAELGFDVVINHKPDTENIGVYKIFLNVNGQEILVYSKSSKDNNGKTIVDNSPSNVNKEIINLILSEIGEQ